MYQGVLMDLWAPGQDSAHNATNTVPSVSRPSNERDSRVAPFERMSSGWAAVQVAEDTSRARFHKSIHLGIVPIKAYPSRGGVAKLRSSV
jgi:hypothetical protein